MTVAPMPGEEKSGLFHALTHLPFFAYLIMFVVLCLAVANLFLQFGLIRNQNWRIPLLGKTSEPKGTKVRLNGPLHKTSHHKGAQLSSTTQAKSVQALDDGIVAVRNISKENDVAPLPPTPLDGTNHALPKFGLSEEGSLSQILDGDVDQINSTTIKDFRFVSAVDRPSLEEIERREKERLVVKGFVKSTDGFPVGSAVVYLSDLKGNKIGQSCRSNTETGAFKVIANESGAYLLNAYKRGYVISTSPHLVPVESGTVDSQEITLVSEGCLVHGRAILESDMASSKNLVIKCVCRSDNFTGTSQIDDAGNFRLTNVPMNSECYLEAISPEGSVLIRTETFETVQKKKLYKDIKIPLPLSVVVDESSDVLNPFIESKTDGLLDETSLGVSVS
ncbi:MAG: carboxypeptidase-like regulatory domain-containing protein [Pseudomonadota bacterium]